MNVSVRATAHVDTFARDRLPPRELWPDLLARAGLSYPERLNAADELLDRRGAGGSAVRRTRDGRVDATTSCASAPDAIARVLVEEMGLVPGNRVLLHGAEHARADRGCWFGVLRAGGVVVATMPLLRARELAKVIAKAQVTHALVDDALVDEVEAARGAASRCCATVRAVRGALERPRGRGRSRPSRHGADDVGDHRVHVRHDRASRRAAMHLHRDLLATCDTLRRATSCDRSPDEVFSGTPPLAFTFGLGGLVLFPMRFGASTAPCAKPGPDAAARGDRAPRRHDAVHRADRLPRDAASRGRARRARLAARVRVGRRDAARRACRTRGSSAPASASSTASASTEMLHIFIASRPEDARPGSTGHRRPGLRGADRGRGRCSELPAGRDRPARRPRPDRLPLPRRPAPVELRRRRLEPHRRRVPDGRRTATSGSRRGPTT